MTSKLAILSNLKGKMHSPRYCTSHIDVPIIVDLIFLNNFCTFFFSHSSINIGSLLKKKKNQIISAFLSYLASSPARCLD